MIRKRKQRSDTVAKKWSEETVREYLNSVGHDLLSEYKNLTEKILVNNRLCDHESYYVTFSNFKFNESRCPGCKAEKIGNLKRIKNPAQLLKNVGLELLSEYKSVCEQVTVKCFAVGHICKAIFANIADSGCPKCNRISAGLEKRLDLETVYNLFLENGLIPLFSSYQNSHERLPAECKKAKHFTTISVHELHRCGKNRNPCAVCSKESFGDRFRLDYDYVKNFVNNIDGYRLISTSYRTNSDKLEIEHTVGKNKHTYNTMFNTFQQGHRCPKCSQPRGAKSPLWKGGESEIITHFRYVVQRSKWARDSVKACHYKCVITGQRRKGIQLHHPINFLKLLILAFESFNIPFERNAKIKKYSTDQLSDIGNKLIELHYENGLGTLLKKEIHEEFHRRYGNKNNTPEQFEEFKNNYKGLL